MDTAVQYSSRPDLPGRLFFACDRMRASLTTDACASFWRASNRASDGGRECCQRCPMGALHAGEAQASTSPLRLTPICARCHRPSSRLIGGHRCVSCYNREREVLRGRNAKGAPPVKLTCLERRRVRYLAGDEPCTLAIAHSLDTAELVVAALRDTSNRVRFGLGVATPPGVRQLRLF